MSAPEAFGFIEDKLLDDIYPENMTSDELLKILKNFSAQEMPFDNALLRHVGMSIDYFHQMSPKDAPALGRSLDLNAEYSLLVCSLGCGSLNFKFAPGDSESLLLSVTLHTANHQTRSLRAIPLGRLLYKGKLTRWVILLDSYALLYAMLADGVDENEPDLCETISDDPDAPEFPDMEEEHICRWWKEALRPGFASEGVLIGKLGGLEVLESRQGSKCKPTPEYGVSSWECRSWKETDEQLQSSAPLTRKRVDISLVGSAALSSPQLDTARKSQDRIKDTGKESATSLPPINNTIHVAQDHTNGIHKVNGSPKPDANDNNSFGKKKSSGSNREFLGPVNGNDSQYVARNGNVKGDSREDQSVHVGPQDGKKTTASKGHSLANGDCDGKI